MTRLVLLFLAGVAAGCGGGSGGSTPAAPTLNLAVNPAAIEPGASVTLAWSSARADSCLASGGWSGPRPVFGSELISELQQSVSFTLVCQGAGGQTSRTVAVAVEDPGPDQGNSPPVISDFRSSASQVALGERVTFSWDAADPDGDTLTCVLDVTGVGPELVFEDCGGSGSQEHVYDEAGTYIPSLRLADEEATVSATLTQQVLSDIALNVVRPQAGALSDIDLQVLATVTSPREIRGVTATVADRTTQLVFGTYPNGRGEVTGFGGSLSLEGLPSGEQMLEVVVEDVTDVRVRVIRPFVLDLVPRLTVDAPLEDTVTARWLRMTASCTDDAPTGCELRVFDGNSDGSGVLASAMDDIDEDIDLSDFDGRAVTLRIEARDSAGQPVATTRRVFVDASPALVRVADFPGLVLDLAGSRVLYRVAGDDGDSMLIATGDSSEPVPVPVGSSVSTGHSFLTPYGAMFVVQSGSVLTARVLDWNRGELEDLGQPNSASSLAVAGDFAIWNSNAPGQSGNRLNLRNLAARSIEVVSDNSGNWRNSLGGNGAVAFWNRQYQVEIYNAGELKLLAADPDLWNTWTATDGERVVYRKHTPCCSNQDYAIVLHDGAGETVLRQAGPQEPSPGRDYQVASGWVAYTDIGNLGQSHVWLVDLAGERRQLTFFGNSSVIERLGPAGAVMLVHGGRRYLGDWGGSLQEVNSALGDAYWNDGDWYVSIGRSVFRISLQGSGP